MILKGLYRPKDSGGNYFPNVSRRQTFSNIHRPHLICWDDDGWYELIPGASTNTEVGVRKLIIVHKLKQFQSFRLNHLKSLSKDFIPGVRLRQDQDKDIWLIWPPSCVRISYLESANDQVEEKGNYCAEVDQVHRLLEKPKLPRRADEPGNLTSIFVCLSIYTSEIMIWSKLWSSLGELKNGPDRFQVDVEVEKSFNNWDDIWANPDVVLIEREEHM